MKRLFTLLTFVLLTMSAIAQQRMNFLGQPLGCSLATFKQRMAAKGYRYDGEKESNIHYFRGKFGGEDVYACAMVSAKSKIVSSVAVTFLSYDSSTPRSTIKLKKRFLLESYMKKYGNDIMADEVCTFLYVDYGFIIIREDYDANYPLSVWYYDNLAEEKAKREEESDY